MKSTELIEQLQKLVAEHGDMGVTVYEEEYGYLDVTEVQMRKLGPAFYYLAIIGDGSGE